MYTNNKRIARLLVVGITMNLCLFSCAYFFDLPLWLDTTGTIFVSCILGSPVGFIVAIVNNLLQAFFFYGEQSLFFYFVSLITAYVTGNVMKRLKNRTIIKWIVLTLVLMLVEGFLAVIITFITTKGIPANSWSIYLYQVFNQKGWNRIISTTISVLAIKLPDVIVTNLIVIVAINLMPSNIVNDDTVILQ